PEEAMQREICESTRRLSQTINRMRQLKIGDPFLVDVEVYLKAALWIDKHKEYYHKDAGKWTLEILDRGLLRASQAMRGDAPWLGQTGRAIARGYRSRLDGSVQP